MKKYILIIMTATGVSMNAQVKIGGATPLTDPAKISLEFADDAPKGMVLPWVYTKVGASTDTDYSAGMPNAATGTLVFDLEDYRFRLKTSASSTGWTPVTDNVISGSDGLGGTVNSTGTTGVDNTKNRTIQDNKTQKSTAKVSIGTPTNTEGILVLEDTNKVMILPRVPEPHKNIQNPAPGMIVYDTTNHMFCLFNGTVWSYWKQ